MASEGGEITPQSLENLVGREGAPHAELRARIFESNTKMRLDNKKYTETKNALLDVLPSDRSRDRVEAFEETSETMATFIADGQWVTELVAAGVPHETIIKVWDAKKERLRKLRAQRTTDQDEQE